MTIQYLGKERSKEEIQSIIETYQNDIKIQKQDIEYLKNTDKSLEEVLNNYQLDFFDVDEFIQCVEGEGIDSIQGAIDFLEENIRDTQLVEIEKLQNLINK